MAGLGIALRGIGKAVKRGILAGAGATLTGNVLGVVAASKTKFKSILKNKPKGPAGKKFKSRMDVIKDSNKRAGTVGMLGTAAMVVGGGELLKRKNPRLRKSKP